MAEENRRVTIYINQKEVDFSLKSIGAEMRKVRNELRGMTIGTEEYNKKAAELKRIEGIYKRHSASLKSASTSQSAFSQGMSGLKGAMGALISPAGLVATGIAAVGAAVVDGLTTMREFETAVTNLGVRTGISGENLDILKDKAAQMARELAVAPKAIVEAFGEAASSRPELMKSTQALADFTAQAIIISKVSGADLKDSIADLSTIMNTNGIATSQTADTVNILVGAAQRGSKEIPFLSQAMQKIGGTAKNANISLAEQAAVIELLGEKYSSSAETVGTNTRNIILELQKNWDTAAEGPFDLTKALDKLGPKINDVNALVEMFGKENVVAAQTLLQNRDRLAELTTEIDNFSGSQDIAIEANNNLDGAINGLSARWDALWVSMSGSNGIATGVVKFFEGLVMAVQDSINSVQSFGLIIESVWDSFTDSKSEKAAKQMEYSAKKNAEAVKNMADSFAVRTDGKVVEDILQTIEILEKRRDSLEKGSANYTANYALQVQKINALNAILTEKQVGTAVAADKEITEEERKEAEKRAKQKRQQVEKAQADAKKAYEQGLSDDLKELEAAFKSETDLLSDNLETQIKMRRLANQSNPAGAVRDSVELQILQDEINGKQAIRQQEVQNELALQREKLELKLITQEEYDRLELESYQKLNNEKLVAEAEFKAAKDQAEADSKAEADEKKRKEAEEDYAFYKEYSEKKAAAELKAQEELKAAQFSVAASAIDVINGYAMMRINERSKNELAALDSKKEKGLISDKQYEQQKEAIQREAFEKKKKLDIAMATVNGAVAVTKVAAETGVLAPVAVIPIIAQTAAQIALIAMQKYEYGGRVKGPSHARGGVPVELEGDEFVVRKSSVNDATLPILEDINRNGSRSLNTITANEDVRRDTGVAQRYADANTSVSTSWRDRSKTKQEKPSDSRVVLTLRDLDRANKRKDKITKIANL